MQSIYTISPLQCQVARKHLGWTQVDLARAAGVVRSTIGVFEDGNSVRRETIVKITKILEKHGVEFTDGEGVKRRDLSAVMYRGFGSGEQFFHDLLESSKERGGEILCVLKSPEVLLRIFGNAGCNDQRRIDLLAQKANVKCLVTEADRPLFDAPSIQFRMTSAAPLNTASSFGYGNKYAAVAQDGQDSFIFCIFNIALEAQNYRMSFLSAWKDAAPLQAHTKLRERTARIRSGV